MRLKSVELKCIETSTSATIFHQLVSSSPGNFLDFLHGAELPRVTCNETSQTQLLQTWVSLLFLGRDQQTREQRKTRHQSTFASRLHVHL